MFVNDTGAKSKFNHFGRFDFFWGDCREFRGGVCYDGNAHAIDALLDKAEFRIVWSPADPTSNREIMMKFSEQLRREAVAREDGPAAVAADLSEFEPGNRFYKLLS